MLVRLLAEVLVDVWLLLMEARACRAFSHSGFSCTGASEAELPPYGHDEFELCWLELVAMSLQENNATAR